MLTGKLKGVVDRQDGDELAVAVVEGGFAGGVGRRRKIAVGEHNALGGAGRSGGEEESAHLIHVDLAVLKPSVACFKPRVSLVEEICEGHYTAGRRLVLRGMDRYKIFDEGKPVGKRAYLFVHHARVELWQNQSALACEVDDFIVVKLLVKRYCNASRRR